MKYFIPRVIEVNNTKIPSTPFNFNKGKAIFLGDVFELHFNDDGVKSKEVYLVSLVEGKYLGTTKNKNKSVELWMLDPANIIVLGSSDVYFGKSIHSVPFQTVQPN